MDHPLVFLRATVPSPLAPGQAERAVDELVEDGIDIEGRHRRVYGWRRGRWFSFTLGVPVLSGRPVLRGRLVPAGGGVEARVSVAARAEALVSVTGGILVLAAGALYQVFLQLAGPEVPEGGRLAGLLSVLPGIAVMAAIVTGWLWWWRRISVGHSELLLQALRVYLEADRAGPEGLPVPAPPID